MCSGTGRITRMKNDIVHRKSTHIMARFAFSPKLKYFQRLTQHDCIFNNSFNHLQFSRPGATLTWLYRISVISVGWCLPVVSNTGSLILAQDILNILVVTLWQWERNWGTRFGFAGLCCILSAMYWPYQINWHYVRYIRSIYITLDGDQPPA